MGAEFSGPRDSWTKAIDGVGLASVQAVAIVRSAETLSNTTVMKAAMLPAITIAIMEAFDSIDEGKTPLLTEGLATGSAGLMTVLFLTGIQKVRDPQTLIVYTGMSMVLTMGSLTLGRYIGTLL